MFTRRPAQVQTSASSLDSALRRFAYIVLAGFVLRHEGLVVKKDMSENIFAGLCA